MLLSKVSFVPHIEHEEFELADAAAAYLAALLRNGQICGEYVSGWSEGIFTVYANLSHRSAYHEKYLSEQGMKELANVNLQFGSPPVWEVLDDRKSDRVSNWKSSKSLYLFTHGLSADSPVNHGDKGTPLPLFLLPVSDSTKERLYVWGEHYSDLDRIWFRSGFLEIPAFTQLADPESELAREGRDLCRDMEAATGRPTYYYLLRHWGDLDSEADRPCPGCGASWRSSDSPYPSRIPFHKFHFRCEECRLVSHRAVCFEQDGHPEIGTWKLR